MTRRTYSRAFGLTIFATIAVAATVDLGWRHSFGMVAACFIGGVAVTGLTRPRRQSCAVIPLPRPKHLHPAAPIGIHDELEGVG